MAGINLKVQIEINGQFVQAGHITGSSFRDVFCFFFHATSFLLEYYVAFCLLCYTNSNCSNTRRYV